MNKVAILMEADTFYHMRTLFFILAIFFLAMSVVLFVKFDIRKNISISKVPVKRKHGVNARKHKPNRKDSTEKLSEETVVLEESEETVVLSEKDLHFIIEKSVEEYVEQ